MGRGEHWGGGELSEPEGENIGREGKTIKGSGAPEGRQKIGRFIKTGEINPEEVLGREAAHEKSPLDELLDMEEAIKAGNYSPQELKDLKRELERLGEGGFDSLALELENKERRGEGTEEYRDREGTQEKIKILAEHQIHPRGP